MATATTATAKATSPMTMLTIIMVRKSFLGSFAIIDVCGLFLKKIADDFQCFSLGCFQVIVYYYNVEFVGIAQFEFCLGNSAFYYFGGIGTTSVQTLAQFLNRRWLDKYRQGTFTVKLFNVASAYYVYVEDDILTGFQLLFYLCFQGSIETVGVNFFVFQKFVVGDALFKFFRSKEKIFYSILFCSAWRTAGCRNRKCQIQVLGKQVIDDSRFARA